MGSALSTSTRPLHATIGENGKVEPDFHHGAQQSSKRMKAITVCTSTYAKHTRRLTASFFKWHPDGSLVVYCDDARIVSKELANLPCRVVELPSIRTIGVKRSKFEAYTLAAEDGDFLYLDSDIIVLGPLDNLQDQNSIVARRDELGECPFIENKLFPWASDPELKADRYINSGVIYFPSALLPTLKEIRLQSLKDDVWRRYTIEGMLSDNHFLCAFLAILNVPIRFADGAKYNWQALRSFNEMLIERRGVEIVNRRSGEPIHLIHFAGIAEIDDFILRLPADVLPLVANAIGARPADILQLFVSSQQTQSLLKPELMIETARLIANYPCEPSLPPTAPTPYLKNAGAFLSLALAEEPSNVTWNGFPCGGAYLNPSEYSFLRNAVVEKELRTALEIGGGYTSMLLNEQVPKVLSIEAHEGPWLDAARSRGCDVQHVPFNAESRRFDDIRLLHLISERNLYAPDLLFIDSPIGTANRESVLRQMEQIVRPRFIAFHDARRDSDMIYQAMLRMNFRMDSYLSTHRGFILLVADSEVPGPPPGARSDSTSCSFSIEILKPDSPMSRSETYRRIRMTNTGASAILAEGPDGLSLSYHLFDEDREATRWDNPRTALPCDLAPRDVIEMDLTFPRAALESEFLAFDLVCDGRYWISQLVPGFVFDLLPLKGI